MKANYFITENSVTNNETVFVLQLQDNSAFEVRIVRSTS